MLKIKRFILAVALFSLIFATSGLMAKQVHSLEAPPLVIAVQDDSYTITITAFEADDRKIAAVNTGTDAFPDFTNIHNASYGITEQGGWGGANAYHTFVIMNQDPIQLTETQFGYTSPFAKANNAETWWTTQYQTHATNFTQTGIFLQAVLIAEQQAVL